MQGLKTKVAGLKTRVASLQTIMQGLKTGVTEQCYEVANKIVRFEDQGCRLEV
jgi:hypothetical protein